MFHHQERQFGTVSEYQKSARFNFGHNRLAGKPTDSGSGGCSNVRYDRRPEVGFTKTFLEVLVQANPPCCHNSIRMFDFRELPLRTTGFSGGSAALDCFFLLQDVLVYVSKDGESMSGLLTRQRLNRLD
jgi:hypothetical protein